MRNKNRAISFNLLILLSLIFLSVPSPAHPFEMAANFDGGVPSYINFGSSTWRYVPTTLPSGTGNAYQCTVGGGGTTSYCGMFITPLAPLTNDVYVRFYIRFMPSWNFLSSQFKAIIFDPAPGRTFVVYERGGPTRSDGNLGALVVEPSPSFCPDSGSPWYGKCWTGVNQLHDGSWHCLEAREYRNGANGAFQVWLDGQLVLNYTNVNAGSGNITSITLGYQNDGAAYGSPMVAEYEDVVVADHYIGPNGEASPSPPPAPPVNLRVQ